MDNVLYEVSYMLDRHTIIPFVVAFGMLCVLIGETKKIRHEKTIRGHKLNLSICSVGLVVSLLACFVSVRSQVDMYQNLIVAYEEGRYMTVEGYVEDFVPMPAEGHAQETFQINGIPFAYSSYSTLQGYHTARVNGGVISGNGQYLKVRYIYYEPWDENVIVYIEEVIP